jgi:hypothetical protein
VPGVCVGPIIAVKDDMVAVNFIPSILINLGNCIEISEIPGARRMSFEGGVARTALQSYGARAAQGRFLTRGLSGANKAFSI